MVQSAPTQIAFPELGARLCDVEFVVVDLETTGGSAADCHITEIGAVRCRGGEVLGEFQTLVNPGVDIPPFIAALTGITDAAVAGAPPLRAVLPAFLEFAGGRANGPTTVLVAHNAPFDVGFLKAACAACDTPWPGFPVLDTARLARVLLPADEVPNRKLATLARHFRASTTPNHRALSDARATVDVLHGLLERAPGFGAFHLDDLVTMSRRVRPEQRSKRTLADGLPTGPGVYRFVAGDGRTLYIGTATAIRSRVRQYFTTSETRARMLEMIRIATRVTAVECASTLEAEVRELRAIAAEQPPYNRRSRRAATALWVRLTDEPAPRLSITRRLPAPDAGFVGPFTSAKTAGRVVELLTAVHQLRSCTQRISARRASPACLRADLGTCLAPCRDPAILPDYARLADTARQGLRHDARPVVSAVEQQMAELAAAQRFEAAAALRNDLQSLLRAIDDQRTLTMLGACPQIVAASADQRDWVVCVIRHGRLAASGRVRPGEDPRTTVDAIVATAEAVPAPDAGLTAATADESRLVARWLFRPGVRLVQVQGTLSLPRIAATATLQHLRAAASARPPEFPRAPRPEPAGIRPGPVRQVVARRQAVG